MNNGVELAQSKTNADSLLLTQPANELDFNILEQVQINDMKRPKSRADMKTF
jgi:hypothetical protein